MPLPLLPIAVGGSLIAAGAALHAWITGESDPWENKAVFNSRMRNMQILGEALNIGFSTCPAFRKNEAQLIAWRGARDGFSKFYGQTGTLSFDPSDAEITQAKDYASKFYFWTGEYNRLHCGGPIADNTDPKPAPVPTPASATDWGEVAKWSAIGIGGAFALKTLTELFRDYRPR